MKANDLLDRLYREVESVILSRQNPVTGLLPASTAVNNHGDYTDAWVRDNVYSIMCIWSLGLAYQKQGEQARSDELKQSTIKLMRGLLQSMMRQSHKVEKFKHTLDPQDSLHAKYDTATGLPVVADNAWGHLQIDATSLFLLMLAQMTASGLRIVLTYSEVDFVQNLMYYVASAYRTPDFGIWERGNKINNGKTEINASSVGMAKAALQALDGFNLFGKNASPRAVVHTVADSISLARNTLATLLPRESLSKEVDSALLSIIGFPAFAIGDESLVTKTRDKILAKLGGNYGCKRFLWDGHQTVVEESSRIYYDHSELANFENIESEWPLFFTYLYIDALFNDNDVTAKHYREKIESLMVDVDGVGLIPELYILPEENIAAEKREPRSQSRVPNENIPLVWAQSLYVTGVLMDEGLLNPEDLDPLKMRRRTTRHVKTQTALVVLAESQEVKEILATHGVIAETLDDIKPMGVISAPHLMDAYSQVGANEALGLTGRPARRLQTLSTSQTYEINGKDFLCLSWLQSDKADYRAYDAKRISHKLEKEIAHIRQHWLNTEVAVFTFMMEKSVCDTPDAEVLFATLRGLQLRTENESVGYASASLAFRASRLNKFIIPNLCLTGLAAAPSKTNLALIERIDSDLVSVMESAVAALGANDGDNYDIVSSILKDHALDALAGENFTVAQLLAVVYEKACEDNHWLTARLCFSALGRIHTVLADGIAQFNARHLAVAIGENKTVAVEVTSSSTDKEVVEQIHAVVDDVLERVLVQETLAIIGSIVRTSPNLFDGLRTIHVHNLLALCAKDQGEFASEGVKYLAGLSPSDLLGKLLEILESQRQIFTQGVRFNFSREDSEYRFFGGAAEQAHAIDTDWLEWRSARGLVTRFDESFLKDIWQSLANTKRIIFGDSKSEECSLDCELIRSSMTPGEESFAQHIDELTQQVHPAYYKSAMVEALYTYTQICKKTPTIVFQDTVDLGAMLELAASAYIKAGKMRLSSTRALDVLIEQSPFKLQMYLKKAFMSTVAEEKA